MGRKSAITIIASEETYKNLSTFNTIDELNETVRYHKENFKTKLSKSAMAVLCHLHNYSAKYFGLSYKSKSNIANDLGISRRTVIRVCQLLESLGIIKQYEMLRPTDKQQTVNAIVIQPVVMKSSNVTRDRQSKCHTKTTSSRKQLPKDKELRTNSVESSNQPVSNSNWIDSEFYKYASNFFHHESEINELYRIAYIHSRINNLQANSLINETIECLKVLVSKLKSRKISNVFGFWNGICKKRFKAIRVRNLFEDVWGIG